MTQEEKARAYDEALKDMRAIYPNLKGDTKLAMEHAFPELRKSEDERIRKTLIHIVKGACSKYGIKYIGDEGEEEELLACLEKQKEQKPVKCIEFDNKFKNQVSHLLASVLNREWEYNSDFVKYTAQQLLGYAKHEINSAEWSKEDEKRWKDVLRLVGEANDKYLKELGRSPLSADILWLNSLSKRFNLQPKQE